MRAFIFGALEVSDIMLLPKKGDLIFAADKGFETVKELKLTPTAVIGDFDSLGYTPKEASIISLPVRKDDTDVGYAIKTALSMGADEFYIYGASGGKLDHTYANIQLAFLLAEKHCANVFFGETSFSAVNERKVVFPKAARGRISVFAANSAEVSLSGLSFSGRKINLNYDFPLGVSNEFIGQPAEIAVISGTVAVMWEDKIIPEFT